MLIGRAVTNAMSASIPKKEKRKNEWGIAKISHQTHIILKFRAAGGFKENDNVEYKKHKEDDEFDEVRIRPFEFHF